MMDLEVTNPSNQAQWEGESDDHKQQVIELLQANLHQLDEVRTSIETQGSNKWFLKFSLKINTLCLRSSNCFYAFPINSRHLSRQQISYP